MKYLLIKVYILLMLIVNVLFKGGFQMTNLDKNVEDQIEAIVEKYQKEDNKLLNYLITDDEITFFSSINNGKEITAEDLQKVAEVLNGTFEGFEIINQEYRFKFKMNL